MDSKVPLMAVSGTQLNRFERTLFRVAFFLRNNQSYLETGA
jgi:hypothetical protein